MMMRFLLAFCLFASLSSAVLAEPFEFSSRTYAGFGQLLRQETSGEVSIKAILDVPPGTGPHPVLVVAHSCAGLNASGHGEKLIRDAAREAGFATLLYDSFDPRNWQNVCTGSAGPAGTPSVIADAFAALDALSADGRFRKEGIFIAGASMGGMTSWFSALEPLRNRLVKSNARYAGHSAFYPSGDHGFIADKVFAGGDVLVMFGQDDDWTPPKRVRLMMERQKSYSKVETPEIRFVDYEGARHGWLNVDIRNAKNLPMASTRLNCPIIYYQLSDTVHLLWVDGREMEAPIAALGKHLSGCAVPGVTIEGNMAVTAKSLAEMTSFMKRVLGK
ncbi:MAG: dienelactone hydrolase family protein [Alphaproteobacteria bacterium]|nr:dienelactone hydrolase family protein [Alphaproteobacteria bacterium]